MNPKIKRIVTALKPRDRVAELLADMDRTFQNAPKVTMVTGPVCQDCGSKNVVYQMHVELPEGMVPANE